MLGTFVISVVLWTDWHNRLVWICLGTTLLLGLLGFWDDYEKIAKKNSKGVSARTKLVWQLAVALVAAYFFAYQAPDGAILTGRITFAAVSGPGDQTEMTDAILVPEQKQFVPYRALFLPFFKDPVVDDLGVLAVLLFAIIIVGA